MGVPVYRANGTAATGSATSLTPNWPASVAAGELVFCIVGNKAEDKTVTFPGGWTHLGSITGGSGAAGVDTGSVRLSVGCIEAAGGESGTITVNFSGLVADGYARMAVYTKAGGTTWGISSIGKGSDNSGGSSDMSIGFDADPGFATDDLALVFFCVNTDNYTHSSWGLSATGLTVGAASVRQNSGIAITNHLRTGLIEFPVTGGPSSGNGTFTNNTTGNTADAPAGAGIILRIREVGGGGGGGNIKAAQKRDTGVLQRFFALNRGLPLFRDFSIREGSYLPGSSSPAPTPAPNDIAEYWVKRRKKNI